MTSRELYLHFQNVQQSFPVAFELGIKGPNPPLPTLVYNLGAIETDSVGGDSNLTPPFT